MTMRLCLLWLGGRRFELYSEPPEETPEEPAPSAGRMRRAVQSASMKWRELVESARNGGSEGRFARWRDQVVCHVAESIAEQRTLWALNRHTCATLLYPASIDEAAARDTLMRVLQCARSHHGRWLAIDLLLFIGSAVLALVPGPNVIAYYLAFRVVTHFQSWRGAGRGPSIGWTLCSDADLAELATLVHVPHAARDSRVRAIAERLDLQRLPTFFDRVAV
jgi:hypothetical protein